MPQDAFHLKRLAAELEERLIHGKINKITQSSKDELTLFIYTKGKVVKLLFSTNATFARVCVTEIEKEPLPVAPNFCMLLRKHLLGGEILSVRQYGFERILEITVHCTGDFSSCNRILHAEVMGKYSNVTLTENGVILGALKPSSLDTLNGRPLFAGAKFVYPHPQDKASPYDQSALRARYQSFTENRESLSEEDTAEFIFNNVSGFAMSTARELLRRPLPRLTLPDLLGWACENLAVEPCVVKKEGEAVEFYAFPVLDGIPCNSLTEAMEMYYGERESKRGFLDKKRKLESAIRALLKKIGKKKQDALERLAESEKAESYRIKGELLTANLYRIEKGMKEAVLENWYEEGCPTVKIVLDPTLPPTKNAQKYFKTYNKLKRAKEILTPILQQEEREEEYAESVLSTLLLAESALDLKEIEAELIALGILKAPKEKVGAKKKELITPYREFFFQGFTVLSGRNNLQNDRLVKSADGKDVWLHAQKYHSSHVLILTEGKKVPDEVIKFAAEICAYYSDGRAGDKIPVDYCEKRFVKKPSKAKAGFVVYTDYKTALASPNAHTESLK